MELNILLKTDEAEEELRGDTEDEGIEHDADEEAPHDEGMADAQIAVVTEPGTGDEGSEALENGFRSVDHVDCRESEIF